MKENTDKAIVINSVLLMARLVITSLCALVVTRLTLQALGVDDFGLFAMLGSFVIFASVINQTMTTTSNRFIAVAIGKGDPDAVRRTFNVNLMIHVAIAIITLIVALPVGDWYIHHYVNYSGPIDNALMVFRFTMIGAILSFLGVPYNGLLQAKERFFVFCGVDVLSNLFKVAVAWSLLSHWSDKLLVYTLTISFLTCYPALVYALYCHIKFPEITRIMVVKDWKHYLDVFKFSAWIGFGAVVTVGKGQGAALIVNAFFSTVMNTALGIANYINQLITLFASNVAQPMAPQLVKSYSAGDFDRCLKLLVMSTKFSFLIMLLISAPFLVSSEWILDLWLGEGQYPQETTCFIYLVITDALVQSFNSGINQIIFASGKIKHYQVGANVLRLVSVGMAWFCLRMGMEAYSLFYCYILVSLLIVVFTQWILSHDLAFPTRMIYKKSYIPSLLVVVLFLPMLYDLGMQGLIRIIVSEIYLLAIVIFVGLSQDERLFLSRMLLKKIHR